MLSGVESPVEDFPLGGSFLGVASGEWRQRACMQN